jgi:hypothetical protein
MFNPATLAAALVVASAFASGKYIHPSHLLGRRKWLSIAGGVAIAYVFVDILPELAEKHEAFLESYGEADVLFAEQRIYLAALAAFVFFYGVEHLLAADRSRRALLTGSIGHGLHVLAFALYAALIGYLLVERLEEGYAALILYAAAMSLHFLTVDHALRREHEERYDRGGRWVLTASVLLGWFVGTTIEISPATLARLFALVAGGVVINSIKEELPSEKEGNFWAFLAGAAGYALLLMVA